MRRLWLPYSGYMKRIKRYTKTAERLIRSLNTNETSCIFSAQGVYEQMKTFDTYNGLISFDNFLEIRESMDILKNCIAIPTGGEIHNGKSYVPIFFMEERDDVKKALKNIATIYGIHMDVV